MKWLIAIMLIFPISCSNADGPPTGDSTAEGVASDMAKAFINANEQLWRSIVLDLNNQEYQMFIEQIADQMIEQSKLPVQQRSGPKKIEAVFKMGKLSKNGPNSYAYAVKQLNEIGFVDVGVSDQNGKKSINRTFVAKKGTRWFVLPRPDLFPLLTMGLNNENRTKEFVYLKK